MNYHGVMFSHIDPCALRAVRGRSVHCIWRTDGGDPRPGDLVMGRREGVMKAKLDGKVFDVRAKEVVKNVSR